MNARRSLRDIKYCVLNLYFFVLRSSNMVNNNNNNNLLFIHTIFNCKQFTKVRAVSSILILSCYILAHVQMLRHLLTHL